MYCAQLAVGRTTLIYQMITIASPYKRQYKHYTIYQRNKAVECERCNGRCNRHRQLAQLNQRAALLTDNRNLQSGLTAFHPLVTVELQDQFYYLVLTKPNFSFTTRYTSFQWNYPNKSLFQCIGHSRALQGVGSPPRRKGFESRVNNRIFTTRSGGFRASEST